jgi:hypothetical protein
VLNSVVLKEPHPYENSTTLLDESEIKPTFDEFITGMVHFLLRRMDLKPSPVVSFQATAGDTQVNVTWTAPTTYANNSPKMLPENWTGV